MRRTILLFTLIGAVLLAFSGVVLAQQTTPRQATPTSSQSEEGPAADEIVPGEILVKFKDNASKAEKAQTHSEMSGRLKKTIPKINVDVVEVPRGEEKNKVSDYESSKRVEFAEPNRVVRAVDDEPKAAHTPNDPQYNQQYQYPRVEADKAWDVTRGTDTAKIAILDTGVDQSHEDLQENKVGVQQDFTSEYYSSGVEDLHGHGTHVAGSASAVTDNGIGVSGTCPGCTLMNGKVLGDDGWGFWDWIAEGIVWAADNDANVINMSLGGSSPSSTVESAVNYASDRGAVVVAAAGNSSSSDRFYPAAFEKVIAVASTDSSDQKSSFSNYGADWVDVAAPGSSILSTVLDHDNLIWGSGVKYGTINGTSMASPHVGGLAGLLFSTDRCNAGDNACVRSQIEDKADQISGTGTYWAKGRINAKASVEQKDTTDTTKPTITLTVPADNATYKLKAVVNANYTCADEEGGSGLESCDGSVPSGSAIDTSTEGTKTFTVTAKDKAGNTETVTHTYKVTKNGKSPGGGKGKK